VQCLCGMLLVGPVREPELDQLVEQLKNMGFDEVCFTPCLSVCVGLWVSLSVCVSLYAINNCCQLLKIMNLICV